MDNLSAKGALAPKQIDGEMFGQSLPSKPTKPTGGKAYGHIPHLPGSRMGPADHHCHEGQARIATIEARDRHDVVSVTVKLDGTCMAIAKIGGVIVPLGRAGYEASTSKYEQHHLFAQWVHQRRGRFLDVLRDDERIVGEWLAQAHGTRYALEHEPFVAFDVMAGAERLPLSDMLLITDKCDLQTPQIISLGPPLSITAARTAIEIPSHGELDPVEGAVWRVERRGKFDFICKWVRPDKVDGKYLPEVSGVEAVWNWRGDGEESI